MNRKCIYFVAAILVSCGKKEHHPQVIEPQGAPNELHLSDQQVQLGNIVTDSLRHQELGDEWQLTGTLAINQNSIINISSKVMGRIEKLYFKVEGEQIHKGQPLYEIFSEDLNLAARELALAIQKRKSLNAGNMDIDQLIRSSENKLSLYGLSSAQINELKNAVSIPEVFTILSPSSGVLTLIDVKEGGYVMEGGSIFHLADLSTVWVEAQVYSDDLAEIKEQMTASVEFPDYPELSTEGRIVFVNPELNQGSKINVVRIEIANRISALRPGMQANIFILRNKINVLALPTDAIILDAKGASVWVKVGHNRFRNTMVEPGLETNQYTEIKSGLSKGDEVAISGAYLLSSEFIFKKGTDAMTGHSH